VGHLLEDIRRPRVYNELVWSGGRRTERTRPSRVRRRVCQLQEGSEVEALEMAALGGTDGRDEPRVGEGAAELQSRGAGDEVVVVVVDHTERGLDVRRRGRRQQRRIMSYVLDDLGRRAGVAEHDHADVGLAVERCEADAVEAGAEGRTR
jgi:hypothetical protein